jgi:arsenite methyltransferase
MPDSDEIDFARPEVAAHYDELPLWSAPFGQLILDRVPLHAGQTVLDVGAGTGFLTVELAQRCGATSTVIAVDPWHAAMEVLREKCRYLGLTNVELSERDAAALDRADSSVDVVVSNLGINNFADPSRVLVECRRVLRPAGTLLMTSNLVGHMGEFYDTYRETLVALGRTDRLPALEEEITHRATVESSIILLQRAGFEVIDTTTGSFRMRYADGTSLLQHYFIRLGFVTGWKGVVDPSDVPIVFAELERRLNERARVHGSLDLTVPTACFTAMVDNRPLT